MVNEARSIARTSSRSPARIRSTERGCTTPELRLGGSQIEWRQLGGADAVAESKPLASQHGHARRRGHAARGRQVARVRRVHAGGAVSHQQGRLAAARRRSEWVTLTSRTYSATSRSPSTSATPPASVEVSRPSTRIVGSLARALKRLADPCDNGGREDAMSAAPKKDPAAVEAEVREKIHLEILKRTGAYHANDHVLLPSGQHTSEYIEKTLVTTEPSFTEGLGAVIAKHFAQWPIDVVLSTGPGALILSHCVARAHPSRPVVVYGTKGLARGTRQVTLPAEFQRLIRPGTKVLLVEDLVSTGSTLNLLIELAEQLGAQIAGVGCLWRRTSVDLGGRPVFSLVSRDFPTYSPEECPLCRKGIPLNEEFVRRRTHRKASAVQEPRAF